MQTAKDGRKKFDGIGGLKFAAIIFMFLWHSPVPKPPIDMGGRLCEFFFVVSGFLFCISRFRSADTVTLGSVVEYMRKKIVQMWPVHLVGFVAGLLLLPVGDWFLPKTLVNAFLNLTLLQSWVNSQYVFWGFNGVSWYLSSLMFAYVFGFLFLKLMRRVRHRWILYAVVFAVRYAFEAIPIHVPDLFWNVSVHISPIARALEFALGMLTADLFMKIDAASAKPMPRVLGSVLELGSLAGSVLIMLWAHQKWLRASYVPMFCVLTLCFAFDRGILSGFFSLKPIRWLSKFQLEIYLFHVLTFNWITYRYPLPKQMLIYSAVLISAVVVYRLLLKRPLEKLVDVCTKRILHSKPKRINETEV